MTRDMAHRFDPDMLHCFLELLPQFRQIRKEIPQ
jgi:hypothetical protein